MKQEKGRLNNDNQMVRLYSYIVRYDTGFAPNPFYGHCTIATCKPRIRSTAQVSDWIIGTGPAVNGRAGYLVYAMRVTETMSFNEYWHDQRFRKKRPQINRGKKRLRGDNIYHFDKRTNLWKQESSFHSCDDGTEDRDTLCKDTKVDRILASDDFIYWGGDGPPIPYFAGVNVCCTTQGHKCRFPDAVVQEFINWIQGFDERGLLGKPSDY